MRPSLLRRLWITARVALASARRMWRTWPTPKEASLARLIICVAAGVLLAFLLIRIL